MVTFVVNSQLTRNVDRSGEPMIATTRNVDRSDEPMIATTIISSTISVNPYDLPIILICPAEKRRRDAA